MALRVRNGTVLQLQDENAVENPRRTKGEGSNMFTPQQPGKQQLKTPGNNKADVRKFGSELGNRTFGADLTNKNSHMSTGGKGQQGESTGHKDKAKKLFQTVSAPTLKSEPKPLLANDPALGEWPARFHFDDIPEESEPVALHNSYPLQDSITSAAPLHFLAPSGPIFDPPGLFEFAPLPTETTSDMSMGMDFGQFSLGPTLEATEMEVGKRADPFGDLGDECKFTQDPHQDTDADRGGAFRSYLDPFMSDLTQPLTLSFVGGEFETEPHLPPTLEKETMDLEWGSTDYDALVQELVLGVSDLCVLPEGKLDLPFFTVDIVC